MSTYLSALRVPSMTTSPHPSTALMQPHTITLPPPCYSVWTERWLATADVTDNYRGYEECDVTKRAGNIKEGSLTVVHGTGDLGVHYHHAMLMSSTLVQAGILFNQISYPDEGHGLEGVSSHLHKVLDQVWDNCFGVLDYTEWEQGTSYFSFKS
uniref:Peptidase_S9 domain-containing protein n=1 Tax=Rhodnius prolixus TaxID=13249 RepID=T1HW10_RHOPR